MCLGAETTFLLLLHHAAEPKCNFWLEQEVLYCMMHYSGVPPLSAACSVCSGFRRGPAPHGLRSRNSGPSKPAAAGAAARPFHGVPFFGREMEMEQLRLRLQEKPASVLVLVGPPSCGITTFLNQVCFFASRLLGLNLLIGWVHGIQPGPIIVSPVYGCRKC